jgi:VanZ family protein
MAATVIPDSRQVIQQGTENFRWDYLEHFVAYFAFGSLYILWRGSAEYTIRGRELILLFVVTCSFSILTEALQLLIPGRTFNPVDIFYNLAGVLSSIIIVYIYFIRHFLRKKHADLN